MNESTLCATLRQPGSMVCRLPGSGDTPQFGLFCNPDKILRTPAIDEIASLFADLEAWISRGGYAAGYVNYEAGKAFEPLLEQFATEGEAVAAFALYQQAPIPIKLPPAEHAGFISGFTPELTEAEYISCVEYIRAAIQAGELYQANFTFRVFAGKVASPEKLFLRLFACHPMPYAAFVHLDDTTALSLSPELFFETDKTGRIFSSPMKGTARRQPEAGADLAAAENLRNDPKNLAENLMIVDMVRNDFGRVCRADSIKVDPLFRIDTYRTVHQMISTVHGQLRPNCSLFDLFAALFPPASITGAPKISAVAHIHATEKSPRRLYTGSIGCIFPNRASCFNVAIRTLLCRTDRTELGIGGGITFYSDPRDEWQEALLKSNFATADVPDFEVLETMRWCRDRGFWDKEEHLARAARSQTYFGRCFDPISLRVKLSALEDEMRNDSRLKDGACVRFTLQADGIAHVTATPLRRPDWKNLPLRVLLSRHRTNADDPFLYHKTTCRKFYDTEFANALQAGFHEVIFFNRAGLLTEGAISNIFLKIGNNWMTPELNCGLLPGIWRQKMLRELHAKEARLTDHDLRNATEIIVGNSLRGKGDVAEVVWESSDALDKQR